MNIHKFKGFWNCESKCRVDYFEGKNAWEGKRVIVVTELDDNTGTSVTNAAEILAKDLKYNPKTDIFVEHYTKESGGYSTYDIVTFEGGAAAWKHISPNDFSINTY